VNLFVGNAMSTKFQEFDVVSNDDPRAWPGCIA